LIWLTLRVVPVWEVRLNMRCHVFPARRSGGHSPRGVARTPSVYRQVVDRKFSTWEAIESGYEFVGLQLESGFICRTQFFQIEQLPADHWQVLDMVEWHQCPIVLGARSASSSRCIEFVDLVKAMRQLWQKIQTNSSPLLEIASNCVKWSAPCARIGKQ
jgi:hypothetical protein